MTESIEARLRDHARAFDSLLQLIPAKIYCGEDTDNQWQRKKQTAEEARAAKRAKLDPDSAKSAKDLMDEKARKRKREEEAEVSDIEAAELEKPEEALKGSKRKTKKQKQDERANNNKTQAKAGEERSSVDAPAAKAAKRREKRERKKAKQQAQAVKQQAKKARKEQETALVEDAKGDIIMGESGGSEEGTGPDVDPIDVTSLVEANDALSGSNSTATSSPAPRSPIFDASTGLSGTSSISSIAPPTFPASDEQPIQPTKKLPQPKANPEELRARLQERIEALRAARKADTADGTPARNRQELMEARRRKEEQRKAHKKELRQKAREEELRQRDLALARGSPLLSPGFMSPASGSHTGPSPLREHAESAPNNFAFGRIAFSDGQQMTPSLDALVDAHKKKGPQDPLTALQAADKRTERISALDLTKRADIDEKDVWLNAKKRAHGERIRDDSSLLKKTLKRKEKAKKKSEKEWGERIEGVQKGQAMRQKKREENLQKRRDEKGLKKGGKGKGPKKGKWKPKVKARPGFEGSFRAKVGGGARK
ncbi:hypothetical protein MMC30_003744 [Trapelia coarctata]|nr:hypothetical protein [Trapelia coarctata]